MDAPVSFSTGQRSLVRQLARRRMFLFFFGLIGASAVIPPYPAGSRALAENFLILAASAAAVAVIALRWRRQSLDDLKLQNNIVLGLVLVIAVSLVALHFSFPGFVFTVLLLVNSFL